MRRDLIIGILVSLLLHGGAAFASKFYTKESAKNLVKEEAPTIEVFTPPPIEPDPPEVVDTSNDAPPDISDIAPPMLADVPSVTLETPFTQPLQPPPPPGMTKPTGAITIPPKSVTGGGGLKSGLGNVFDLKDLDQQPVARFQARPNYPFEMRRAGVKGEVTVGFIVDTDGNVRDAYAIKSSQREFEAPAIQAVMKWKFRPGKKGGRPQNTRMQVPIVFSIAED